MDIKVVIILLLYIDDIIIMARSFYDHDKQLEKICKSMDLWLWDKKKLLFGTLITPDMVVKFGAATPLENYGER
jgi:hypothetical protein